MKNIFILLCFFSVSTFASEVERHRDGCGEVVETLSKKYRELSEISSRMMILGRDGSDNYSVDFRESENCETNVSESQVLQRRKESIEQELERLEAQRKSACPRVYPE